MAVLAIEGHPKRGNEVIEILEMLGGKNFSNFNGASNMYYLIGIIDPKILCISKLELDKSSVQFTCFTLEEFLEKFPYKVGDKVLYKIYGIYSRIKSMLWNVEKEQVFYRLDSNKLFVATADELKPRKEETIKESIDKTNKVIFDTQAQSCDIMNDIIKKGINK